MGALKVAIKSFEWRCGVERKQTSECQLRAADACECEPTQMLRGIHNTVQMDLKMLTVFIANWVDNWIQLRFENIIR